MSVSIAQGVVAVAPKQIVAGTNITTTETDSTITINATGGGGGGGAVDSVNGQTGIVVLDATDVGADPAGSAATAQSNAIAAIPAQFNPIAGTNVSLTGTYPNITFNASGGGGGGSATVTQVTLDFGSTPVYSKAISFTDVSITATSKVLMTPHATNDELEMDGFVCAVKCGTGTATAYIQAIPGPVTGTRLFNYTIG